MILTKEKIAKILDDLRDADIQKIVQYDIKNEWKESFDEFIKLENNIFGTKKNFEKMNKYEKIVTYKKYANLLGVDCDISLRSMVIYALAFDYVLKNKRTLEEQKNFNPNKHKYYFKNDKEDFIYCGDTMNSFKQITDCYLNFLYKEKKFISNFNGLSDYATLNHTVGNFIPIPFHKFGKWTLSFNIARNAVLGDYFDLVLENIYHWYQTKEENYLLNIISGKKEQNVKNKKFIELLMKWLEEFGSWKEFVKKNYLESFLEKERPKEFWTGHFTSKITPQNYQQCEEFFTNVTLMISKRGNSIAKKVKEVLSSYSNKEIIGKYFDGVE